MQNTVHPWHPYPCKWCLPSYSTPSPEEVQELAAEAYEYTTVEPEPVDLTCSHLHVSEVFGPITCTLVAGHGGRHFWTEDLAVEEWQTNRVQVWK